jgi:hypothetical protein
MSEPLSPELEAQAQELATRITARSADAVLEIARRLVVTTDETLFGDTEFALRDQALRLVAHAYAEHLPQKVGIPVPPSTAPSANGPPRSMRTGTKRSKPSAGRSRADGPTTTAGFAPPARAPGTRASE